MIYEVRETEEFRDWLDHLKDGEAQRRVAVRIRRIVEGNFGDSKFVGEGVLELRIHYGRGYRLYFAKKGAQLILLLAGGDKRSQNRDILVARRLAHEWKA